MRRSTKLQDWQPVAVNAIDELRKKGLARGCVLGDVVGFGKTWVVIAYLLHVCLRNLSQLWNLLTSRSATLRASHDAKKRTRKPSAQLREELESAVAGITSSEGHEEEALRFLFVPFPDVKDIAEETHIAIDASNTSDRFLARYPMYNAENMSMIQQSKTPPKGETGVQASTPGRPPAFAGTVDR